MIQPLNTHTRNYKQGETPAKFTSKAGTTMPGFMSEEWYQPLNDSPNTWQMLINLSAGLFAELGYNLKARLKRFISQPPKKAPSLPVVRHAIQAKPVVQPTENGERRIIWEPGEMQQHSIGVSSHHIPSPFEKKEIESHLDDEPHIPSSSEIIPPNSINTLDKLSDINAWINQNIDINNESEVCMEPIEIISSDGFSNAYTDEETFLKSEITLEESTLVDTLEKVTAHVRYTHESVSPVDEISVKEKSIAIRNDMDALVASYFETHQDI